MGRLVLGEEKLLLEQFGRLVVEHTVRPVLPPAQTPEDDREIYRVDQTHTDRERAVDVRAGAPSDIHKLTDEGIWIPRRVDILRALLIGAVTHLKRGLGVHFLELDCVGVAAHAVRPDR